MNYKYKFSKTSILLSYIYYEEGQRWNGVFLRVFRDWTILLAGLKIFGVDVPLKLIPLCATTYIICNIILGEYLLNNAMLKQKIEKIQRRWSPNWQRMIKGIEET